MSNGSALSAEGDAPPEAGGLSAREDAGDLSADALSASGGFWWSKSSFLRSSLDWPALGRAAPARLAFLVGESESVPLLRESVEREAEVEALARILEEREVVREETLVFEEEDAPGREDCGACFLCLVELALEIVLSVGLSSAPSASASAPVCCGEGRVDRKRLRLVTLFGGELARRRAAVTASSTAVAASSCWRLALASAAVATTTASSGSGERGLERGGGLLGRVGEAVNGVWPSRLSRLSRRVASRTCSS